MLISSVVMAGHTPVHPALAKVGLAVFRDLSVFWRQWA